MDLNFMDELLFEGCWLETTDGFSFLQPGASTSSALNDSSHHSLTFENPNTPQKSYGDDGQRSSLPENPPPFYPQAEGLVGTQSDNWKTFEAATASGQSESFLVERTELNRRLWIGPSANPGPVSSVKNRLILAIRNLREFTKERDVLIQIWVPIERGGKNVLTTNDQPFSLDPDCQSLANYRNVSENYHFPAEEDSKEQVGLPGRVFLGKVPEWTPDVRFFKSEEYPRINYAQRYNVRGSLALPVFERGSGVCLGVIEIVTTLKRSIIAVDLRSSEVLIPPVKACNELYQAALPEILKVLARVCRTHRLPLAQTWAPCIQQGKGGCRHSDKNYALFLSTVDHAYYVTDPKFKGFNEACFDHHLFRGQGVVGRALTTNQPCFESDITAFSKTEYPLSHHARMFGLRAAVAIRLKSIYNGSADFILEFFLPTDCQETEEQKQVLNSLSIVIQQTYERVKQEGSVKLLSPPIKEPSREESSWIAHMMEAQKKGKGVSVSLEYQKEEPEEEFKVTTNWDNTEVELHHGQVFSEFGQPQQNSGAKGSVEGGGDSSFGGQHSSGSRKAREKRRTKTEKTISLQVLSQYFAGSLKDAAKSIGDSNFDTMVWTLCPQVAAGVPHYPEKDMQATWDHPLAFPEDQESWPLIKETPACDRLSPRMTDDSKQLNPQSEVLFSPGVTTSKSPSSSCSQSSSSSFCCSTGAKQQSTTVNASVSGDVLMAEDPVLLKRTRSDAELHVSNPDEPKLLSNSRALRDGGGFRIKATFGEENVRFSLQLNWSFKDLQQEIARRFGIDNMNSIDLKYLDDDCEWVLLTCDADLEECIDVYRSCQSRKIKLSLHHSSRLKLKSSAFSSGPS
ncbi:Protein NLP2 [Vitis vinifera]|uniref:Protein NLP2 n=1 Tax=Vitis vinifera TaxID=29760 RepID=A0A438EKX9_VITVI|nr:Protein NLP2 [Vitis vinifera]